MWKKSLSRLQRILAGVRTDTAEPVVEAGGTKLEKFAHFWVLVWRSFVRNRCPVRASALSYWSLLALVPMLAVALSVTSIFLKSEGEDQIYQFIDRMVASVMPPAELGRRELSPPLPANAFFDQGPLLPFATNPDSAGPGTNVTALTNPPPVSADIASTNAPPSTDNTRVVLAQKKAARYIHQFIQNVRGGTLSAAGTVMLIFVAISMFSRIEATFNDIWGVARGRNWFVRIMLYWTVPTLGTLLLTAALLLASGPQFQSVQQFVSRTPFIGNMIFEALPVAVVCLTFALIYQFVPNTKVHFGAALVGGIVGGTLWHLNNAIAVLYVSRVVSSSKIYGSLGLVPVFMAGLCASWLILLFGAQVSYAFQNRKSYLQEKLAENVNQRGREFVALRLMTCIGQRFQRGVPPVTLPEISDELGIPTQLIEQVLETLMLARLVVEVSGGEPAYAPGRPLEAINCHHILLAMRALQGQELVTRDEPVRAEVFGEFARIQAAEKEAASRVTLLALVNRAQAGRELPAAAEGSMNAPAPLEVVTELPNEPAVPTEAPPLKAGETAGSQAATVADAGGPRGEKEIEPARKPKEPPADEDRDFPL